jgi:hypothetical protein
LIFVVTRLPDTGEIGAGLGEGRAADACKEPRAERNEAQWFHMGLRKDTGCDFVWFSEITPGVVSNCLFYMRPDYG